MNKPKPEEDEPKAGPDTDGPKEAEGAGAAVESKLKEDLGTGALAILAAWMSLRRRDILILLPVHPRLFAAILL